MVVVRRGGRECAPGSEEEEAESGSTGGGATAKMKKATMGGIDVARKPRGRPPGSKNKPKPPIVITRDAENAMRPHVLELCAGCDVVESVAQFARRHHLGLCVISGKGTVANVSLHHPATAAGAQSGRPSATTLTFHGRFDILSLTGTYLLPTSPSSPSTSSFTISLAGAQGQVVGGTVAGSLVAASPVVLIAAAFNNPSFHRLPAEGEDVRMSSGGGGGVKKENEAELEACPMSMYDPLSCQLPHDAFTWVPTSRAPPPY